MADEFKHASVGAELSQAEWESTTVHVLNDQATGDLVYASSATQLSRLPVGTSGQSLTVAGGIPTWATPTVLEHSFSYTTSNFTKNANTTFSDVPDLSFPIGASEVWYFEVDAQCVVPSTPGMKMLFTVPSGATATGSAIAFGSSAVRAQRVSNWTVSKSVFASGGQQGTTCRLSGLVVSSSTAGTVQLQAAQETSTATDCTIYAGSTIIAWRMA
jgi:hypothetical protein